MTQQVAQFTPPRLPHHPWIEKQFEIDGVQWKTLVEAIFPAAQSSESVVMALAYCRERKLDVFKRCVHIVPIWDKERRCMVDTVWPSIAELRTTAHRTKSYAGKAPTEFGSDVEATYGDHKVKHPEWAQISVFRVVAGIGRVEFSGPRVYWSETYSSKKDGSPTAMWLQRPRGQLEKCAEAAALRVAFPEELGNELAAEEVGNRTEGRVIDMRKEQAKEAHELIMAATPVDEPKTVDVSEEEIEQAEAKTASELFEADEAQEYD
jgi:phage recombination protein Bet